MRLRKPPPAPPEGGLSATSSVWCLPQFSDSNVDSWGLTDLWRVPPYTQGMYSALVGGRGVTMLWCLRLSVVRSRSCCALYFKILLFWKRGASTRRLIRPVRPAPEDLRSLELLKSALAAPLSESSRAFWVVVNVPISVYWVFWNLSRLTWLSFTLSKYFCLSSLPWAISWFWCETGSWSSLSFHDCFFFKCWGEFGLSFK